MIIYQPHADSLTRTSWYGGESTQLHYERYIDGYWSDQAVRTLSNGMPTGMSEMHEELVDYYNYCQ